jgi:hypothetical protein
MEREKKNNSGAPSSDTTSALFVSARKKQLQQQEEERRAKEKEDARLAAEAEVRRLELEVEQRRLKAEEDKKQAERQAVRQAAAPPPSPQPVQSVFPPQTSAQPAAAKGKKALDNKTIGLIGAGAAVVVIGAILAIVFGSGGSKKAEKYLTESGIDIRGVFYNTDIVGESVTFADDGTLVLTEDSGGTTDGTYTIDGDSIDANIAGEERIFNVLTADNLQDDRAVDYSRTRPEAPPAEVEPVTAEEEPKAPAPQQQAAATAPPINPDANLDTVVIIQQMKYGFSYPSTEFTVSSHTGDKVVLDSLDGKCSILFQMLSRRERRQGRHTEADIKKAMDAAMATLRKGDSSFGVHDINPKTGGVPNAFFQANYKGPDGASRYVFVGFTSWQNVTDKSYSILMVMADCPDATADGYMKLFQKILDTRFDA